MEVGEDKKDEKQPDTSPNSFFLKVCYSTASLSGNESFTGSIDEHGEEPSLSRRAHDTQISN
jgi:hypothetical protein